MNLKQLFEFIDLGLAHVDPSTDKGQDQKRRFHLRGKQLCQVIADRMELAPGTYDIRSNKGGFGIRGEITLHGERIYIQFGGSCASLPMGFMYRSCQGRKDYHGGRNCWMKFEALTDLDKAVATFKATAAAAEPTLLPARGNR